MSMDGELGELWHAVEARREDGTPAMFRIRELEPKKHLTKIFAVELTYPKTELSRLPSVADYRRFGELEKQWVRPACAALGWEVVGRKIEDGSCFFYMYGHGDPNAMIERLSPFDPTLGFYDDDDPDWQEYGTLRDLLDRAKAISTEAATRQRAITKPIANRPAARWTANGAPTGKAAPAPAAPKRSARTKPARAKTTKTAKAAPRAKAKKPSSTAKPKRSAKAATRTRAAKAARRNKANKPTRTAKQTRATAAAKVRTKPGARAARKSQRV